MQRNQALDALRGLAILAMVLSGSIAFGILPAWMYHAQEPPPSHVFDPTLPGITWVDLVFPFFLFSMGAAIPLALHNKVAAGATAREILSVAARRFLTLLFVAVFTRHMAYSSLSAAPQPVHYLSTLGGFGLLFFQLYRPPASANNRVWKIVKTLAFVTGIGLLIALPFRDGNGFSWQRTDIILAILASMASAGAVIWWLTRTRPLVRVGMLLFFLALMLGAKQPGSWNAQVWDWSLFAPAFQVSFLKYFFVLIPGTFAGDWLLKHSSDTASQYRHREITATALLSFAVILLNLFCLYKRMIVLNLVLNAGCCALIGYLLRKPAVKNSLVAVFGRAAMLLLFLGLFAEAFEGGIKKDPATLSYLLLTPGLAFFMLVVLQRLQFAAAGKAVTRYLATNGRNPVLAYVTGGLLLLPLLQLSGAISWYQALLGKPWTGFLAGVLFTGLVSVITVFFTRKGWILKT